MEEVEELYKEVNKVWPKNFNFAIVADGICVSDRNYKNDYIQYDVIKPKMNLKENIVIINKPFFGVFYMRTNIFYKYTIYLYIKTNQLFIKNLKR